MNLIFYEIYSRLVLYIKRVTLDPVNTVWNYCRITDRQYLYIQNLSKQCMCIKAYNVKHKTLNYVNVIRLIKTKNKIVLCVIFQLYL